MRLPGWLERALLPKFLGRCARCNRPWRRGRYTDDPPWKGRIGVEPHTTKYNASNACFPLCEGCWSKLTPQERLPYYAQLVQEWMVMLPTERARYREQWPLIEAAVKAGL